MDFSNFEEHLDKNEFNHSFLRLNHPKLIQYLMEIFSLKKSAIECFLSTNSAIRGVIGTRGSNGPFP